MVGVLGVANLACDLGDRRVPSKQASAEFQAEMQMLDKTESDRAANPNEKPENCYCSALPKGSGLCLPCYTRWLADRRLQSSPPR